MIDWDKLIEDEINANRETRDHSKFRVSDSGMCHRMRFWKRKNSYKSEMDSHNLETKKIFTIGHLVHGFLQNILKKRGLAKLIEARVENEHFIGHVDLVTSDYIVYDIKSAGTRKMQHIRSRKVPDIHHAYQAMTSAILLEENDLVSHVNDVRILYVGKERMDFIDLSAYKTVSEKAVIKDMETLVDYWVRDELPPPEPKQKWECNYCPFKNVCEV